MSFDFVPRAVKKRRVEPIVSTSLPTSVTNNQNLGPAHNIASEATKNAAPVTKIISDQASTPSASTSKTKLTVTASKGLELELLAGLVWLSLSDYAVWADVDLRRKIDVQSREGEQDDTNEAHGYIPLAYLFKHSRIFIQALSSGSFVHHPETIYVKALRTHATDLIDVRLVLSSEEPSFGGQASRTWSSGPGAQTGYEVRIKPNTKIGDNDSSVLGKADWDRRTIYAENIPIQHRSLPGTLKFIATLLPSTSSSSIQYSRIQNISFPAHHRAQPNSIPTCKGFALITLSTIHDVEWLLDNWPWDAIVSTHSSKLKDREVTCSQETQDAVKFGFRTVSKERWINQKAEYLLFRQQLVEELNEFQENEQAIRRKEKGTSSTFRPGSSGERSHERNHPAQEAGHFSAETVPTGLSQIHAASSYPSGCLVFVRHLHRETNKTTLRTLFMQAWKSDNGTSSNSKSNDGIDYLDYLKGMDTCHIRLSTPLHAQQFVGYVSTHPTVQKSGLDGTGMLLESSQSGSSSPITAELVSGKREEVYWEKVPEKIRRQAVEKALKILNDVVDMEGTFVDGKTSVGVGNTPGGFKRRGR